jgi:predicted nucleic acid-binding protein
MISKKVYIASDGFVAFIDRVNKNHMHAVSLFSYFAREQYQLYTNIVSFNETYTAIYNTISPALARDFLNEMYVSNITILYPELAETKAAIKAVDSYNAVDLTFSKALMSVICNKKSIPQIMTYEYLHSLFGLKVIHEKRNEDKERNNA